MKSHNRITFSAITLAILLLLFASAFATNKAVNVYSENEQLKKRACVIIDAGHGGVDGGAVSCTGVEESQINLEIALRLNDLMHLLGINTYMIRTDDVSIYTSGNSIAAKKVSDLKERVKIINQTPNAILVSVHQNYFQDSRYSGAQVFYYQDATLAKQLQTALVKTLKPESKRKAKRADGVYLMQNIHCPAALIECGFLSNPAEEAQLRDAEYQKKLCCVIGSVVSCYIYNCSIA